MSRPRRGDGTVYSYGSLSIEKWRRFDEEPLYLLLYATQKHSGSGWMDRKTYTVCTYISQENRNPYTLG
jgi:hypothetical protein